MDDAAVVGRGRRGRPVPARRRRRSLLVEANPKTARVHLRLVLDTVGCEECMLPPDDAARDDQRSLQRRIVGEFELVLDDPRQHDRRRARTTHNSTRGARSLPCTSRCCTTSCTRSRSEAGLDSGVFSALAYLARAEPPGRLPLGELHESDAPALQPARVEPSRAAHGGRRAGRAAHRSRDGRATVLVMTRAGRARVSTGPTRCTPGPSARALRAPSVGGGGPRARGRARARLREDARFRVRGRVPFGPDDQVHRFETTAGARAR